MVRIIVCLFLMAGMALALPVTWNLQGTFTDGGTLSGFFVFNADDNTVTNWDIFATAGTVLAAFEYTPANSQVIPASSTPFAFRSNAQFPTTVGSLANRILLIRFVSPLTNAGGTVLVNVASNQGDESRECINCSPARRFNAGSQLTGTPVSAVPLSPWALVLTAIGILVIAWRRMRQTRTQAI